MVPLHWTLKYTYDNCEKYVAFDTSSQKNSYSEILCDYHCWHDFLALRWYKNSEVTFELKYLLDQNEAPRGQTVAGIAIGIARNSALLGESIKMIWHVNVKQKDYKIYGIFEFPHCFIFRVFFFFFNLKLFTEPPHLISCSFPFSFKSPVFTSSVERAAMNPVFSCVQSSVCKMLLLLLLWWKPKPKPKPPVLASTEAGEGDMVVMVTWGLGSSRQGWLE